MARNVPKRRSNRTGSISINSQANRYMVVWTDETGKRRTRSVWPLTNEGRRDAEMFLNNIIAMRQIGVSTAKTPTLNEYIDKYISASERNLRLSTLLIRQMSQRLLKKTLPKLCETPISEITPQYIEQSYLLLTEQGVSPSAILRIKNLLNLVFNRAVIFGVIRQNPCSGIKTPRVIKKNIEILSWREIGKVFLFINKQSKHNRVTHNYTLIFRLLHGLGIRVGELLALKWSDIDIPNRRIHIHSTVSGKHGVNIELPKTSAGDRYVPIFSEKTYNLLKKEKPSTDAYICETSQGTRMIYNNLLREWSLIRKYTGIKVSLHSWRHTAASLWLSKKGFPLATVSKLLGHANPSITLEIYTHALPSTDDALIKLYNSKK